MTEGSILVTGATGTVGCIALRRRDMLIVLSKLKAKAYLVI
jgi:L,D-peptidoglycan transpeptidase YkuD (ErfK/YbiS/YcfS/YnhG family)